MDIRLRKLSYVTVCSVLWLVNDPRWVQLGVEICCSDSANKSSVLIFRGNISTTFFQRFFSFEKSHFISLTLYFLQKQTQTKKSFKMIINQSKLKCWLYFLCFYRCWVTIWGAGSWELSKYRLGLTGGRIIEPNHFRRDLSLSVNWFRPAAHQKALSRSWITAKLQLNDSQTTDKLQPNDSWMTDKLL